jgi:hypothetical protein
VLVRHDMISRGGQVDPAIPVTGVSLMEIPMGQLPGNKVTPVPAAAPIGQTPSNYHSVPDTAQQPSGQVTSMFVIKRM